MAKTRHKSPAPRCATSTPAPQPSPTSPSYSTRPTGDELAQLAVGAGQVHHRKSTST